MKFGHKFTGDEVEAPPPDRMGRSVIRFNGRVVERVTYSDAIPGGSVTTDDGRVYSGDEWALYLVEQLGNGAWRIIQ